MTTALPEIKKTEQKKKRKEILLLMQVKDGLPT